jgi:phosphoribosylformylglycinamidine synthase subunit PurL
MPDLNVIASITPADALLQLLASPNIGSRLPVTRTYDSTIMTNTVVGPGYGDAAVMRIKGTNRGLAMKTDCNPRYCYLDPYLGGMHAVLEAARNIACVGGEALAITNCLNFGSPERPEVYFQLKRAIEGMSAACRALSAPVVSGNVSLYNESGAEPILPTPTVGAVGVLDDVRRHADSAFQPSGAVYLVGSFASTLGGSEYLSRIHHRAAGAPPEIDLELELRTQHVTRRAIQEGLVVAAHDCSEGGLAVALSECCIAGGVGGRFDLRPIAGANDNRVDQTLFGESASRVILQCQPDRRRELESLLSKMKVPFALLGETGGSVFEIEGLLSLSVATIANAWSSALEG